MNGTSETQRASTPVADPAAGEAVAGRPAPNRLAKLALRMACYTTGACFALLSVLHLITVAAMITTPLPENGADMSWMVPAITLSSAVAGAIAAVACVTVGRRLR